MAVRLPFYILALALAAGCAPLPKHQPGIESHTLADSAQTPLGTRFAALAEPHPGLSAFHILPSGLHALAARAGLIDAARHTLDLQYYMVRSGVATDYLLEKVVAAADRGVRVRFLIDDSSVWGRDAGTAALSLHPNIEVRVFNSIGVGRGTSFGRAMALTLGVGRLHRRMHNKMLAADNVAAVVGDRNLADEYFGTSPEMNFADTDLLLAGPVVRELSGSFDEYWNSQWAVPIESITAAPAHADAGTLLTQLHARVEKSRQRDAEYLENVDRSSERTRTLDPELRFVWAQGHAVYDSPEKMGDDGKLGSPLHIGPRLEKLLDPVQSQLVIVSAYFIPGDDGSQRFEELARRGVDVKVLTNGLAATDVTAVYAAYAPYRQRLLRGGVELYELRRDPGARDQARKYGLLAGSSSASLRTKAMVIDGRYTFVGSMNLDPRSQRWNTEVGVLVDSVPLAQMLLDLAYVGMQPDNSYRVRLEGEGRKARIIWIGIVNGEEKRYTSDPAGLWRRFESGVMGWVLPEELL